MKQFKRSFLIGLICTFLASFLSIATAYYQHAAQAASIVENRDEIPLYGETPKTDAEKAADEKFIEEIEHSGLTRKKGAEKMLQSGWIFYRDKKAKLAVREFNKAWLLDPTNWQIYWGLALSMSMRRDYDAAIKWFTKAQELFTDYHDKEHYSKLLGTFGRTYDLKAITCSTKECDAFVNKAIKLFSQAEKVDPSLDKIYSNWAVALDIKKDYKGALEMAKKAKELGDKTVTDKFLEHLQAEISLSSKKNGNPSTSVSHYCDKSQAILAKKCKSNSALDKLVTVNVDIDSEGQISAVEITQKSRDLPSENKQAALGILSELNTLAAPPSEIKFPLRLSVDMQNMPLNVSVCRRDIDWKPYMAEVEYQIKRYWMPPISSEHKSNVVAFYILRDGDIADLKIKNTSGVNLYDQQALDTVRRAAPFFPLPDGAPARVNIDFTFDYKCITQYLSLQSSIN